MANPPATVSALDRARSKAYLRLLPLLFLSYAIAYVDRINVSLAKLKMTKDLPGFDNAVIGFGAGIFFIGYFLLEIPGTLLVEKWSARKWICRIMISWGIIAALTAFVKTPVQFYTVRFFLGLAEAGFFPGVIVYLTHWFPVRDRARALSWFFIATPVAQFVSPKLSYFLLRIGTTETIGDVTVHLPGALGHAGLAVDVHRLGHPGGDPGDPGPVQAARLAQGCTLARARRARRPGAGAEAREGAAQAGAWPHDASSRRCVIPRCCCWPRPISSSCRPATASSSSCPASWRSGTS